ncbi:hypothetical protein [Streptomyces caniscabiei]|uniref:hypothetical protein n=1 Tax=Streptomyces caniscabiei TaxID=2746961 RepID=UPI0015C4F134|nr:hypothetical protein [Streptomyces caniscabiei]
MSSKSRQIVGLSHPAGLPRIVRIALTELVQSGDARVQRGQEPADAERLEAHQRFRLVMNGTTSTRNGCT